MSQTNRQPKQTRKQTVKSHPNPVPAAQILTRDGLEESMIRWAYSREGPIAGNYIVGLVGHGAVLEALEEVAASMQSKPNIFDDDVAMVQSAWMNFRHFGSPGFPVHTASSMRDMMASMIEEVEVEEDDFDF